MEPVVAWRTWKVVRPDFLADLSSWEVWPHREKYVASCRTYNPCAVSPQEDCRCGIYAAKTIVRLNEVVSNAVIYGEVYLWGKIVEHAKGYRAQFAYPKAIVASSILLASPELLMKLSLAYGVEFRAGVELNQHPEVREWNAHRTERMKAEREAERLRKYAETKARNLLMKKKAQELGVWDEIEALVRRQSE